MQNRYVGDVGDYGKYALLRGLCGPQARRSVRLGVVWCLFPDETVNNDGRHVSYLANAQFAQLDVDLPRALNTIVSEGRRNISAICDGGCLPAATVFCPEPISTPDGARTGPTERLRYRNHWQQECLRLTKECDLVFFDPDNGLEVRSVPKHHPKAGKYIYWDEIAPYWRRGSALLIYHHLNRTVSAAQQVEGLALRFTTEFDCASVHPLVFRRGSSRVFWLVHRRDALGRELESRAADMLNGGWSQHFRPFGWPGNDQASTRAP